MGAIAIFKNVVQPFTDKQVQLVTTFADQAAIAIENVRLFNEIQTKSSELEIANRHKLDFLSRMSHELRTPLNAIIGFSEVLQERMFGDVNEKQAEYLRDIHSSGMHLLSLINDILDLSKIDAGRMELELSRFDLVDALNNALSLVRERAARNGVTLALECDPNMGEWTADERMFKQIMLNLLSNAVKFTPSGGRVDVRVERGDRCVLIAVSDTGIGIDPADQKLVFEEFRQAGRRSSRKAEGTGLGLALTRKFVELHEGRIELQSEPGKGSTFTFMLPEKADAVTVMMPTPRSSRAPIEESDVTVLMTPVTASSRTQAHVSANPSLPAIEKLLATYMGPMAKILVANATKSARSDEELIESLAEVIDAERDRSAFRTHAAGIMAGSRRTQA
jgi:signal transduction histidine kinase